MDHDDDDDVDDALLKSVGGAFEQATPGQRAHHATTYTYTLYPKKGRNPTSFSTTTATSSSSSSSVRTDDSWEEGNHQPDNSTRFGGTWSLQQNHPHRHGYHGHHTQSPAASAAAAAAGAAARRPNYHQQRQLQHQHFHRHHNHNYETERGFDDDNGVRVALAAAAPPSTLLSRTSSASSFGVAHLFCPVDSWMLDRDAKRCCNSNCEAVFGLIVRRHHCRCCGDIFCGSCCPKRLLSPELATAAAAASIPAPTAASSASSTGMASASASALAASPVRDRVRVCNECYNAHIAGDPGGAAAVGPDFTADLFSDDSVDASSVEVEVEGGRPRPRVGSAVSDFMEEEESDYFSSGSPLHALHQQQQRQRQQQHQHQHQHQHQQDYVDDGYYYGAKLQHHGHTGHNFWQRNNYGNGNRQHTGHALVGHYDRHHHHQQQQQQQQPLPHLHHQGGLFSGFDDGGL